MAEPGAVSTGGEATVTATEAGVADALAWSVAFTVIVSGAVEWSVSFSVSRVALISVSVPSMVRLVVPEPPTESAPETVAASNPLVSAMVTANVAVGAEPGSDRVMVPSGLGWLTPTVAAAGATMTGALVTETAIDAATAAPPRLSVAVIPITSDGATVSVSVNVASAASTSTMVPLTVTLVMSLLLIPAPSGLVIDSRPLVSLSTTVKLSPEVLPVSEMLTPVIAVARPAEVPTLAGAEITGGPFTVTAISNGVPAPPWADVAVEYRSCRSRLRRRHPSGSPGCCRYPSARR